MEGKETAFHLFLRQRKQGGSMFDTVKSRCASEQRDLSRRQQRRGLALTRGGPPRKMVPLPLTMMLSSHIAGT